MVHNRRIPGEIVPQPADPGVRPKNPAPGQPPPVHRGPIENESRLEALIGSIDEIVFELDREGTFLNIWTTNEELLYRPRHELKGKRVSGVIGEEFFRPAYAGKRDEVFAEWSGKIKELAGCSNVYIKLGGLGMKMFGFDVHARAEDGFYGGLAAAGAGV